MTPLHIQLMLHYYAIAEPYAKDDPDHAESRAVQEYTAQLVRDGMLYASQESESGYVCTDRGHAYIEALKAVKLPILITEWKIPA